MSRIFISYRRDDSAGWAGRVYDRLAGHFGKENIFMDIDTLEPGVDFVEVIERTVDSCDLLVAVIGRNWLSVAGAESHRRLDDPNDFVRLEIAAAINRNIRLIPLLVGGTSMPLESELPDALKRLSRRNALEISDVRFHHDADRLIAGIEKAIAEHRDPEAQTPTFEPPSQGGTSPDPPTDSRAIDDGGQTDGTTAASTISLKMLTLATVGCIALVAGYLLLTRGDSNPGLQPEVEQSSTQLEIEQTRTRPVPGTVRTNPIDGLNYRWIPPGTFQMGCVSDDNDCYSYEKPRHPVTISRGFWLGESEVTQTAWNRVMKTDPSRVKGDNLPVETVSWEEANRYCQAVGGRLPTEAEWEYAARGGKPDLVYPWGSQISHNDANYSDTGRRDTLSETAPVCSFPPNGYGLCDMAGNVWEWTADWYDEKYYSPVVATDPKGPSSGKLRILRGGSWDDFAS